MDTEYDVFEILINRSVKWHLCVREKHRALDILRALGTRTFNECFATDLGTREIIGRVNDEPFGAQSIVEEHRANTN
jgi:hypothetical protein